MLSHAVVYFARHHNRTSGGNGESNKSRKMKRFLAMEGLIGMKRFPTIKGLFGFLFLTT
jgi:hypothetical protein